MKLVPPTVYLVVMCPGCVTQEPEEQKDLANRGVF